MQDNITRAIEIVNQINAAETQLKTLREQLRLLVGAPTVAAKPGRVVRAATRSKNARVRKPGDRNISATVREYVTANPGVAVPQILDALGLRANEATVRAALKKSKEKGDFVSVGGRWAVVAKVQTQESPTGVLPNGAVPHAGEGWDGARYTE